MKCAVITPVGPGHETLFKQCKASIDSAITHSQGPFAEITSLSIDDTQGLNGRSHCRNEAIREACKQGFDWLFFLDADDILLPNAFETARAYIHDYDAIWGLITELVQGETQGRIRLPQLFTITTLEDVLFFDPFITLQMGHFVKSKIALKHLFAEQMNAGEDFDYYLKLWTHHKCIKIDQPLFVNRRGLTSQGPRSANGVDWRNNVQKVINDYIQNLNYSEEEKNRIRQQTTARFIEYAKAHNLLSQCDPKLCAAFFPIPS